MTSHSFVRSGLPKAQTRISLASFNWNLAYRGVFDTICGGSTFIFVAFALSVDIAKEKMGLVTAAASLACILQMFGLPVINRLKDRKRFVVRLGVLEPLAMIAAVLLVPILPAGLRLYGLVAAVFMAAACLHLTRPVFDDWVAATIPAGLRGRFLGRRFQLTALMGLIAAPLVGWLAHSIDQADTLGLALLLCIGGGFGLLAALALRRATMPPGSALSQVRVMDILAAVRVKPFRRYLIGLGIMLLPFYIVIPYYHVYHLSIAGMSTTMIGLMIGLYGLMKIIAAPLWGRFMNRLGPRRIMMAICPLYALLFSAYVFCGPQEVWFLFLVWALCGIGDGGWGVATQAALYGCVPPLGARPAFFAVANLVALGLYGLGAPVSVILLDLLKDVQISVGPLVLRQFNILYAGAALVMIPATFGALLFPSTRRRPSLVKSPLLSAPSTPAVEEP